MTGREVAAAPSFCHSRLTPDAAPRRQTGDTDAMTLRKQVIVEAWNETYSESILLELGDRVSVVRRDDEWPGFVWCIATDGGEGWVPEELLKFRAPSEATATAPYDARELTVVVGERVQTFDSLAGWTWCEATDGRAGWVPDRCLADG
jgi:hypothetical protein